MNPRLLLIKSLTLLVRGAEVPNTDKEKNAELVRSVIKSIRFPDISTVVDSESRTLLGLKSLVLSLTEKGAIDNLSIDSVIQQVSAFAEDDPAVIASIRKGIEGELSEARLLRLTVSLYQELTNYLREKLSEKIMQDALNKVRFERNAITDFGKFITEVIASLEPYQREAVEKDPAIVNEINFDRVEDLADYYVKITEKADGKSLLKTGWQELNDMFRGGIGRGEEVMHAGLQHQYKTGLNLTLFRQLLIYNDAQEHLIDKTKKPMMVRISFEDSIEENLDQLYRQIMHNEAKHWPEDDEMAQKDPKEIASVVMNRLRSRGWEVRMLRVDPTQWTYVDILNKLAMYEAEGYEVAVLMVDYLKMIPTTGCIQGIAGFDIRDLFRRIRNYCSPRNITFITPHQLSSQAKDLLRDGRPDFIKFVAGKSYLDGSRSLDQELDLEFYHHIEEYKGKYYLALQRGKHRRTGVTPQEHLYVLMPFDGKGCILDNINGPKTGCRKLGAGPIGSPQEKQLWHLDDEF